MTSTEIDKFMTNDIDAIAKYRYIHVIHKPLQSYGFLHFESQIAASTFYRAFVEKGIETPQGRLQVSAARYWKSNNYVNYYTTTEIAAILKEKAPTEPEPEPDSAPAPKRKREDPETDSGFEDLTAVDRLIANRQQAFLSLLNGCIKKIRCDTAQAGAQEDCLREALSRLVKTVVKATELENLDI
ncbi:hypothetical protein HDU85_001032 [Gaertneriomyces sp. JEL0708]|nr:hypothetical protein HDU85_001032 [Gaertneriomyces sp. JEL0708]